MLNILEPESIMLGLDYVYTKIHHSPHEHLRITAECNWAADVGCIFFPSCTSLIHVTPGPLFLQDVTGHSGLDDALPATFLPRIHRWRGGQRALRWGRFQEKPTVCADRRVTGKLRQVIIASFQCSVALRSSSTANGKLSRSVHRCTEPPGSAPDSARCLGCHTTFPRS